MERARLLSQVTGTHSNTLMKLSGSSLTGQKVLPIKEGAAGEKEEAAAGVEDRGQVASQTAGLPWRLLWPPWECGQEVGPSPALTQQRHFHLL